MASNSTDTPSASDDSSPTDDEHSSAAGAGEYAEVVDAREIDGEPFSAIMAALDDLDPDGTMLLMNSFEPTPLYDVLAGRGFVHETTQVDDEVWHVEIVHGE